MILPSWITVAKWVGLAAIVLALVGTPIVYMNDKISQAQESGYKQGYSTKQHEDDVARDEEAKRNNRLQENELSEAQKRSQDNEKLQRQAAYWEQQFRNAMAGQQMPASCIYRAPAVRVFRDAAIGNFNSIDVSHLPSGPSSKMP